MKPALAGLLMGSALLLSGCGTPGGEGVALMGGGGMETHAMQIQFDDGRPAWWISCPGALNNIGSCMERARAICKAPPLVLNPSPQLAAGRASERSIFVRCTEQ